MVRVAICIVNYNTKELLKDCILSILNFTKIEHEIIVVDNASTDGSVDMLKHYFPRVKIIANSENMGFTKANNLAIKNSGAEYVVLLNSDTVLVTNIIDKMINFMDVHLNAGVASCKFLGPDLKIQPTSYSFPSCWVLLFHILNLKRYIPKGEIKRILFKVIGKFSIGNLASYLTAQDIDVVKEVDVVSAACMIIRRKALSEVGYCDENYFLGPDDYDLCMRIREIGSKIYLIPEVGIIHFVGEGSKKAFGNPLPVKLYEGWFYFFKKHKKYFGIQRRIFLGIIIPFVLKIKYLLRSIHRSTVGDNVARDYLSLIHLSRLYSE